MRTDLFAPCTCGAHRWWWWPGWDRIIPPHCPLGHCFIILSTTWDTQEGGQWYFDDDALVGWWWLVSTLCMHACPPACETLLHPFALPHKWDTPCIHFPANTHVPHWWMLLLDTKTEATTNQWRRTCYPRGSHPSPGIGFRKIKII